MNIKCPNCNTIFDLKSKNLKENITKFKCIVCSHIWLYKTEKIKKKIILEEAGPSYKKIIILNLILIFIFVILLVVFKDELKYIDNTWRSFYLKFESLIPIK